MLSLNTLTTATFVSRIGCARSILFSPTMSVIVMYILKMFRHNPSAKYEPSGGRYLQILSGKHLYNQTIVVSSDDNFYARFPNIFVNYPNANRR